MPIRHARFVPWILIALAAFVSNSAATCPENFYYCNQKTFSSFEPRVSLDCLGDPANQIGRSS